MDNIILTILILVGLFLLFVIGFAIKVRKKRKEEKVERVDEEEIKEGEETEKVKNAFPFSLSKIVTFCVVLIVVTLMGSIILQNLSQITDSSILNNETSPVLFSEVLPTMMLIAVITMVLGLIFQAFSTFILFDRKERQVPRLPVRF